MNKKLKRAKKTLKHSPVLFEDEEIGTSSSDEVKIGKFSATPNSKRYTDHSTPIRNQPKADLFDSPDLNYNESPIEPLTQNPPNEVGWNYQRPIIREEDATTSLTVNLNHTPKRSVLLAKKRNSNSPLLYKPLKKKLIQEEQQESMVGFMAELKAIATKAIKIGEKNIEIPQKNENEIESQLIVEMDSQPMDDSDIKLQVSVHTDESPRQNKIMHKNKNYDALLDDSIEDIMILCSQEVEEKEYGVKKVHCPISTDTSKETNVSKSSSDSSTEKLLKENIQPAVSSEKITNDIFNKGESLEIPDDSFDEFFVGIDDKDFCKNINTEVFIDSLNKTIKSYNKCHTKSASVPVSTITTSKNSNKFFQSKNSTRITQTQNISTVNNCNYVNCTQATNALIQNKVINSKANFGYLNKDFTRNSSGFVSQTQTSSINNDKTSETRLYKAKSFSDSNFCEQNISNNFNKSISNLSINPQIRQEQENKNSVNQPLGSSYNISESSVQHKSWRRVHSSSSINKSNINGKNEQININKLSNSEGSQSVFTPAEIEKKRQEAILRREAKLKIKFTNATVKRPIQNPIKR